MNISHSRLFGIVIAVIGLIASVQVYADGSRELYDGVSGNRAYLRVHTASTENWPFPNRGNHYVYAKRGETITLASSAVISTNKRIHLYDPDGIEITSSLEGSGTNGIISNRTEETGGPRAKGATSGGGYVPFYYSINATTGKEGVYRVEFESTGTGSGAPDIGATASWTQPAGSALIAAWDISVHNTATRVFIKGRVYANQLTMNIVSSSSTSKGFYTKIYVLTKDGYIYRVNNNGSNGIYFTFFVNNNGFFKEGTRVPGYESLTTSTYATIKDRVHNPNYADIVDENEAQITHKLFYTVPDQTMPDSAAIATTTNANGTAGTYNTSATWQSGKTTWLQKTPKTPNVEPNSISLVGADGVVGQISNKGGKIKFRGDANGTYRILISSTQTKGDPLWFEPRILTGPASSGWNEIPWDGRAGKEDEPIVPDKLLPPGLVPVKVEVVLQGAEVHFPFFDMEYNSRGIIIELLDETKLHLDPVPARGANADLIYWNDKKITISNGSNSKEESHLYGKTGVHSNAGTPPGAHKWVDNFGNERSIDTWTFIEGEKDEVTTQASVKTADLRIRSLAKNRSIVRKGDEVEFTVEVQNGFDGPGYYNSPVESALFTFTLPGGFTHKAVTLVGIQEGSAPPPGTGITASAEVVPISFNTTTNRYESRLTFLNQAIFTYKFTATVTATSTKWDADDMKAIATILRPDDVTDPDATNKSDPLKPLADVSTYVPWPDMTNWPNVNDKHVKPFDAHYECMFRDETLMDELKAGLYTYLDKTQPCNNIATTSLTPVYNFWHGTESSVWTDTRNWTDQIVPEVGEDIEFATAANNGTSSEPGRGTGSQQGAAVRDLHLDGADQKYPADTDYSGGRIIGDLINKSAMNLVVTKGNQLRIDGKVHDGNTGILVVEADGNNAVANGTLLFKNPGINTDTQAKVQFYNRAYDCATCGYFRRSWQYFGIPVTTVANPFPTTSALGAITVRQWLETKDGDKWESNVSTVYALKPFKGYEMTSARTTPTTDVHELSGKLNLVNMDETMSYTTTVNYTGVNLIGNSYTAAIPISELQLGNGTAAQMEQTVYLFNTGTRDQWKKLNGDKHNEEGLAAGQYLAVPKGLAGTTPAGSSTALPAIIPSTHAFMVLAKTTGVQVKMEYNKLTKNALVNGVATRSASTAPATQLPSLVMDVIGETSVDRLWIFNKQGATHGFDDGWDGRKMPEEGITQLYVAATDNSQLQVATVPNMDRVAVGFVPNIDGKYTLEFALNDLLLRDEVYLNDAVTGTRLRITNGSTYTFNAKKGDNPNRFSFSYKSVGGVFSADELLIDVLLTDEGVLKVTNRSNKPCTVFISDEAGNLMQRNEAPAGGEIAVEGLAKGTYIVRLQNAVVNDVRKITK